MMARGVLDAEFDAFEDFGLGFFAEAVELGDFIFEAGFLELFNGFEAEFVVQALIFLGRVREWSAWHEAGRNGVF